MVILTGDTHGAYDRIEEFCEERDTTTEDIFITRNGKVVAKLSDPHQDRVDIAKSLFGILPADVTLEEAKEERLDWI